MLIFDSFGLVSGGFWLKRLGFRHASLEAARFLVPRFMFSH